MPELPEVETIKRDLEAFLLNKTIVKAEVLDRTLLTGHKVHGRFRRKVNAGAFCAALAGKKIVKFHRRGKYIAMEFADATALIFHLRMTGQLLLSQPEIRERARFEMSDGAKLWFVDRRRFGEVVFSTDWKNDPAIRKLGPEPLDGELTGSLLKAAFQKRDMPVHSALLNQTLLSGLGNIYVVESLHKARISPARKAGQIKIGQLNLLSDAIQKTLEASIENRGYSMHTYVDAMGKKGRSQLFTLAYGKEGKPCTFCGAVLVRRVITGRGVVYCKQCQK